MLLPQHASARPMTSVTNSHSTATTTINYASGPLAGSQNVLITGGTFISASTVHYGIHELLRVMSLGAIHDSAELARILFRAGASWTRSHRRIRDEIEAWIKDPNPEHLILWVSGHPWTGATRMLREISDDLSSERRGLGDGNVVASFFFNKAIERGEDSAYLPSTISYQLAVNIPGMRQVIAHIMEDNPTLPSKNMERQLDSLVISPFRLLDPSLHPSPTPTVVIGSLDECRDPNDQHRLLEVVSQALEAPQPPLRFLILSTPNPDIVEFFERQEKSQMTHHIDLDRELSLQVEEELYTLLFYTEDPFDGSRGRRFTTIISILFLGQPREYVRKMQDMWIDGCIQYEAVQEMVVIEKQMWVFYAFVGACWMGIGMDRLYQHWRNPVMTTLALGTSFTYFFLGFGLSLASLFLLMRVTTTDGLKATIHGLRSLCKRNRGENIGIFLSLPFALLMWSVVLAYILAASESPGGWRDTEPIRIALGLI